MVQLIDSASREPKPNHEILFNYADFAAVIMADIQEKRAILPVQSRSSLSISALFDDLAPQLEAVQGTGPNAATSFGRFFDGTYKQEFQKAVDALEQEEAENEH